MQRKFINHGAPIVALVVSSLASGIYLGASAQQAGTEPVAPADTEALRAARSIDRTFTPAIGDDERATRFARWKRHVDAARLDAE